MISAVIAEVVTHAIPIHDGTAGTGVDLAESDGLRAAVIGLVCIIVGVDGWCRWM